MFHQFPYTNMHEINLDWLIKKVKEAYSPDNPPENIVLSVNGQTGDVVLYEGALVELPAIPENDMWQIRRNTQGNINRGIAFAGNGRAYIIEGSENHQIYDSENPPPYPVTSVNSATGAVILYQNPSVIFPEVEDTTWRIFRNAGGTTLGIRFTNGKIYRINSTDNFEMYDAGNPPPYPVTSVNGQTGAVNITFPVTSVNGQTGAVNLQIPFVNTAPEILEFQTDSPGDYWGMKRTTTNGDVGIYFDSENNTVKAYITYMPEDESVQQPQTFQLLTTNDIPSSSGVVSVNGKTGVVVIRATDISRTENNAETVETALTRIDQKDGTQDIAISGLQGDVAKIHQSIAIIADGDTHSAIQAGQAVFVKNHSTLATGLYWANSAIGTDAALTSVNLTADTSGGFNHIQDEIASLNSNLDQKDRAQDMAISGLQGDVSKIHQSMAIIADGDTHTAIQAGQAVFVKNHSTLATGLYWANSAIGTDAALTSANLTADTSGGFNHIQDEIASLNSNLDQKTFIFGGYYQETSNYTFTLPEAPQEGHSYYVILCHYTSSTSIAVDTIFLSFSSATTMRSAWIAHNSSVNISGVSVSGWTVTIAFEEKTYVTGHFIKCF